MTTVTLRKADFRHTGRERSFTYGWRVKPLDANNTISIDEDRRAYAELSISHWPDRKCYAATLTLALHGMMSGCRSVMYSPLTHNTPILREPCARYSAKGLEAFADKAIEVLTARLDEPEIAAIFPAECR